MKSNPIKKPVIAVFLLLIFFQQVGAGLYIHNLFHSNEKPGQVATQPAIDSKEISLSCSCVDNFLMPFIGAGTRVVSVFSSAHLTPVGSFSERTYFTSLIFSSLRGPPIV